MAAEPSDRRTKAGVPTGASIVKLPALSDTGNGPVPAFAVTVPETGCVACQKVPDTGWVACQNVPVTGTDACVPFKLTCRACVLASTFSDVTSAAVVEPFAPPRLIAFVVPPVSVASFAKPVSGFVVGLATVTVPLTGCVACQNVPDTGCVAGRFDTDTLPLTGWVAGKLLTPMWPSLSIASFCVVAVGSWTVTSVAPGPGPLPLPIAAASC